ncbi:MAG TPA: cyclic nucleotide-binding domain-containing protein [Gaiellaceae bacterium]
MFGKSAKVELLKRVPLFADCSKRELSYIAQVSDEKSFPAGHTLIEEGTLGREFFVIAEGTVEVRRGGRKLPQRGDPHSIGEIALLSQTPRSATVTTTSPVRALVITGRAFRQLLADVPSLSPKLLASLAARLPQD